MKINSEKLYQYINELATNEKVKFKVYYDDTYTTDILWNGENFEWESGRFSSEAFFNPLYDFEVIEDKPKHIEELKIEQDGATYYIKNEFRTKCYLTKHSKIIADKFNELSKAVNYLLDKDKQ